MNNAMIYKELKSEIKERIKAQDDLKEFISMVSHELRTPITVLKSSLGILKKYKEKLSPEQKIETLEIIRSNTDLMGELIEDLLIVSKVDENKLKLEYRAFNLRNIISEVLKLLEPRSKSKNIIFEVKCDDLNLEADKRRVNQIIRIFVDNALKYSNEGGIIEINVVDNYKGEFNTFRLEGILIEIKDHGIGISEQDQKLLFQRYFRSNSVKNIAGTGLGLYIAKEFIKLHKGSINVISNLGKGTSFFIFFPKRNQNL